MFSGLIQEVSTITKSQRINQKQIITVSYPQAFSVKIGDSIALNGICLTVFKITGQQISFEIMNSTKNRSNYNQLKRGKKVNLEPALSANSRLDGHIVSGHIDTTAKLSKVTKTGNNYLYSFSLENTDLIVQQGSIAIDGVSLTVVTKSENSFTVSVIEHTKNHTIFNDYQINQTVNIEFDQLVKINQTKQVKKNKITIEKLLKAGF